MGAHRQAPRQPGHGQRADPGYVLTDLTRRTGVPLRVVVLTGFKAHMALDGADTVIWLAASSQVEGMTVKFWNERRQVRCRFRDKVAVEHLWILAEQQIAATSPTVP